MICKRVSKGWARLQRQTEERNRHSRWKEGHAKMPGETGSGPITGDLVRVAENAAEKEPGPLNWPQRRRCQAALSGSGAGVASSPRDEGGQERG